MNHTGKGPMLGDNPATVKGAEDIILNYPFEDDGGKICQTIDPAILSIFEAIETLPNTTRDDALPIQANGSQSTEYVPGVDREAEGCGFQEPKSMRPVTHIMENNTLLGLRGKGNPTTMKGADNFVLDPTFGDDGSEICNLFPPDISVASEAINPPPNILSNDVFPIQANGSQSTAYVPGVTREAESCEFQVLESKRPVTHIMENNTLLGKRGKGIPFKATNVKPGCAVEVGLRYITEGHRHKRVVVCGIHREDPNDPGYPIYIPNLLTEKEEDQGHLILKIPVSPHYLEPDGTFSFSLVFRCWNYCHRAYGKDLEAVLKLRNVEGEVLSEGRIPLIISEHLPRTKKSLKKRLAKKRCAQETEGPAPKKVRLKKEEGGAVMQPQASTSAPQLLSSSDIHELLKSLREVKSDMKILLESLREAAALVQSLVTHIIREQGDNVGGESSGPLSTI